MSDANFQTFLVGGLLVLIGAVSFMAWCFWRYIDRERDMEKLSLAGVGHELRVNLQRLISELGAVSRGEGKSASDLLPMTHPQLDAVLARPVEADRRALTVIHAAYDELGGRKLDIRSSMAEGHDFSAALNAAIEATIAAIGTLYLWEEHKGAAPTAARSTRTWAVRDWMKMHRFDAKAVPGMHLRDEVVECLRTYGMALTPKPLTYTANEYYAKLYDRKADPNAPFWKRKIKPKAEEADEPMPEPAASLAEAEVMPEPVAPETAPEEPSIEVADAAEPTEIAEVDEAAPKEPQFQT